jgi:outer membrane lipoprotein SlyB
MKKFLVMLPLVAALAACETQEQNQIVGTLTGAAIGSTVSNDGDKGKGVLIGGLAGLAAGTLIGQKDSQGRCLYQRPDGTRYYASC